MIGSCRMTAIPTPSVRPVKPPGRPASRHDPDQGIRRRDRSGDHATHRGLPHTGQVPRIYRADHTAHIGDRQKNQALYFTTGVIMAVLGAIAFAILLSLLGEAHHTLTVAAWGLVIVLALVSGSASRSPASSTSSTAVDGPNSTPRARRSSVSCTPDCTGPSTTSDPGTSSDARCRAFCL